MVDEREGTSDEGRPVSAEDSEAAKMRRYDRMAWVLFTMPILIVLAIVAIRSCAGGGS